LTNGINPEWRHQLDRLRTENAEWRRSANSRNAHTPLQHELKRQETSLADCLAAIVDIAENGGTTVEVAERLLAVRERLELVNELSDKTLAEAQAANDERKRDK
jgi:hypothetical protein